MCVCVCVCVCLFVRAFHPCSLVCAFACLFNFEVGVGVLVLVSMLVRGLLSDVFGVSVLKHVRIIPRGTARVLRQGWR